MPDAVSADRGTQPPGRVLVVVPTYNERDNIRRVVQRVLEVTPEVDVLVVDDDSPDGTGRIADDLARAEPRVSVLHRTGKTGLGTAYLAGFDLALKRGYDVIGEMDADGSHRPEHLPELLAALADADLVIGSRWVEGGTVVNWPLWREALSRGGNLYTRAVLGTGVRDSTAGYRLFRRSALERLDLDHVDSHGYVFQADLAWRAVEAGLRVVEVPIEFVEREHGVSKMSGRVAAESLWRITRWGARHRVEQARHVLWRQRSRLAGPPDDQPRAGAPRPPR